MKSTNPYVPFRTMCFWQENLITIPISLEKNISKCQYGWYNILFGYFDLGIKLHQPFYLLNYFIKIITLRKIISDSAKRVANHVYTVYPEP